MKTFGKALLAALLAVLLVSGSVLAAYAAAITVTESGSNSYPMLPISVTMDNSDLADSYYITSTGLDTRILQADTPLPHMLAGDRTLFALPISADTQYQLTYSTGSGALDSFYTIVGYNGFIGITDTASLELGNAFEIEMKGYVNTSLSEVFPIIVATDTSASTSGTSHTVDLPSGVAYGDLLLVFFTYGTDGTVTFPSGWTQLFVHYYSVGLGCWYSIADGTEGSSIAVTTSLATVSAHASYRIIEYSGVPSAGTPSQGDSVSPNPSNFTPSGGILDRLWIAACGYNADSAIDVTGYPTNYTDGFFEVNGVTGGCGVGSARRELSAGSENPGAFTIDTAERWVANTVAVQGSTETLVYKDGAFNLFISGDGEITAVMPAVGSVVASYDPTADGSLNEGTLTGETSRWTAMQDDLDTSYLLNNAGSNETDMFVNPAIYTDRIYDIINSVTVYWRSKEGTTNCDGNSALGIGGTQYYGDQENFTTSWVWRNHEWVTNPATGIAWKYGDLEGLEFGFRQAEDAGADAMTSEVYVAIDYAPSAQVTATGISSGVHTIKVVSDGWTGIMRPSGVGTYTEFEDLVGEATHWETVDETTPDDAVTHVGSDVGNKRDTFALSDVDVPDGYTIESVIVYEWTRREGSLDDDFYIMIRSNVTDDLSDLFSGISSTWAYRSYTLYEDPDTSAAWTESGVNALEAGAKISTGVDLSQVYVVVTAYESDSLGLYIDGELKDSSFSPSAPDNDNNWILMQGNAMPYMEYMIINIGNDVSSEILRPNAVGDDTNIGSQFPVTGQHWEKVDDVSPDDLDTFVFGTGTSYLWDLYNLPNGSGLGDITAVRVYARCAPNKNGADQHSLRICIKTGGIVWAIDDETMSQVADEFVNYNTVWTTNPYTSSAWTWDEINALQIGIELRDMHSDGDNAATLCTQVYVEIVSTGEKLYFQPNTMIDGTSLPDRGINISGTVDSGSTTTLIDDVLTQVGNYWNNITLEIITTTDGEAPQGETAIVTDFIAVDNELQFDALTAIIETGDTYELRNDGSIAWGSNPSGIASTIGALLPELLSAADVTTGVEDPSFVPETPDTSWFETGVEGEGFPFYGLFKGLLDTYKDLGGADISMPYFWKIVAGILGLMFGTFILLATRSFLIGAVGYTIGFVVPATMGVLEWWMIIVYLMGAIPLCILTTKWRTV